MEVAKAYILEDNTQILSIDSSIDSNFSSELNLRGVIFLEKMSLILFTINIVNIGIEGFQLFILLMKLFH